MQLEYLLKDPIGITPPPYESSFEFSANGSRLFGSMFFAGGPGKKPAAVILTGFPGFTMHTDIARALARCGMTAVMFRFRGSWGSGGEYRISHLAEDARAMLDYLRENADGLNIDPDRLALIGHSMGGFTAMNVMASDAPPAAAVLMAPYDLGMIFKDFKDELAELFEEADRLNIGDRDAFLADVAAVAPSCAFTAIAPRLKGSKLFFIGGSGDTVADPRRHIEPVKRLLPDACYALLHDDHAFSLRRLELITLIAAWLGGNV